MSDQFKTGFIDEQAMVQRLNVGDKVKLPISTRGNRYAPYVGQVTHIHDGIGQVDVQTPTGNIRVNATEVVYIDEQSGEGDEHMPDTSYDTYDRDLSDHEHLDEEGYSFAQPHASSIPERVATRHQARLATLVEQARQMLKSVESPTPEVALYDRLYRAYGNDQFSEYDCRQAAKIAVQEHSAEEGQSSGGRMDLEDIQDTLIRMGSESPEIRDDVEVVLDALHHDPSVRTALRGDFSSGRGDLMTKWDKLQRNVDDERCLNFVLNWLGGEKAMELFHHITNNHNFSISWASYNQYMEVADAIRQHARWSAEQLGDAIVKAISVNEFESILEDAYRQFRIPWDGSVDQ